MELALCTATSNIHTYILSLGFVFAGFYAPTVSLSAILGESHVRRKPIT